MEFNDFITVQLVENANHLNEVHCVRSHTSCYVMYVILKLEGMLLIMDVFLDLRQLASIRDLKTAISDIG